MGVFRQFPYSNFHEMNMDQIIKTIKDMLEEWARYYSEWDNWKEQVQHEWDEMVIYINNYFDNLDVQEEINNKITSMVNSGEFADIVDPFIPSEVASWLAAHITEPVGVVIDTSLSVTGACADAKVTGDAIRNINGSTNYTLIENICIGDTGTELVNSAYNVYKVEIPTGGKIYGTTALANNANAYIGFYDDNGDLVGDLYRNTEAGTYEYNFNLTPPAGAVIAKISFRKSSGVSFTVSIGNHNKILQFYNSLYNQYKDTLDGMSDYETVDFTGIVDGYYINEYGQKIANAQYSISPVISLTIGDTINVYCQSSSGNVSVIAEKLIGAFLILNLTFL